MVVWGGKVGGGGGYEAVNGQTGDLSGTTLNLEELSILFSHFSSFSRVTVSEDVSEM